MRARAPAGQPTPLAVTYAVAQARGLKVFVHIRPVSRFRVGRFEFQLGENRRILYPGLSGNA